MAEMEIAEINREVARDTEGLIRRTEAGFREKRADLARHITEKKTRVVLLAGPSSSGKTTTANLLADTLRAGGHSATVISLDDFYYSKGDPHYPKNERGEPDFEAPESLRIDLIRKTIAAIESSERVYLPRFDFRAGKSYDRATELVVPDGGCVIIEGLHALNPCMTEGVNTDSVTRVFVSVSTNITDGGVRLLSGKKVRFIRRLTRDFLYRASSAARTYELWSGVLAGEKKYLYPYRDTADFYFDTFHPFEIGVMRPFAEQVLDDAPEFREEYVEVVRRAVGRFETIPLSLLPEDSLIREFVPGGIYEKLY